MRSNGKRQGNVPSAIDQQEANMEALQPPSNRETPAETGKPSQVRGRSEQIELRIVTEVNRVQPNMPTHGVPYDMIDVSETSAYSDLIEKLRQKQLQEENQI